MCVFVCICEYDVIFQIDHSNIHIFYFENGANTCDLYKICLYYKFLITKDPLTLLDIYNNKEALYLLLILLLFKNFIIIIIKRYSNN